MTVQTGRDEPVAAGSRKRWFIVALLMAITTLNLMDRQLPYIMAEQIREEFSLTDTQLGMLGGLAFSLVYALAALPLARLADRGKRKSVLAICVFAWSMFTGLGSFAMSFVQLMMTRIGVALGEAAATPVSHALLADIFPDRRRSLAIGLVTSGISLGVLLGMALGGWLLVHFNWREVLILATVPGIILAAALFWLVPEPPRITAVGATMPPIGESLQILARNRAFVWLNVGTVSGTFATTGGATFGAAFLIREHGLDVGSAGVTFGLMMGLTGAIGATLSGMLGTKLSARDTRWLAWLPAFGAAVQFPFYVASWMVQDLHLAIALQTVGWFAGSSKLTMSYTAVQAIVPSHLRAFSSATVQLLLNIIGNVLGPITVGVLSDWLGKDGGGALGPALAITGCGLLLAAFAFARAGVAMCTLQSTEAT